MAMVTEKALQDLTAVLGRLRGDLLGELSQIGTWLNPQFDHGPTPYPGFSGSALLGPKSSLPSASLNTSYRALTQLREHRVALAHLSDAVEIHINRLQGELNGFQRLPNEILNLIFEMACSQGANVVLNLSVLSRRFRAVALHNPKLWSTLEISHLSERMIRLYLKRSKKSLLDISFDNSKTVVHLEPAKLIGLLVEHCDRWGSLSFPNPAMNTSNSAGIYMRAFRGMRKRQRSLTLRNLSQLRGHGLSADEMMTVSKWSMPMLSRFECGTLPTITHDLACLTEFRLSRCSARWNAVIDAMSIVSCLRQSPNLHTLELELSHGAVMGSVERERVSFPGIRSLSVEVRPGNGIDMRKSISSLLSSLLFPQLHHVSLTWTNPEIMRFQELFDLLGVGQQMASVEELTLSSVNPLSDGTLIQSSLCVFPNLRHLHILAEHSNLPLRRSNDPFRGIGDDCLLPLQVLHFKHCKNITEAHAKRLALKLKSLSSWPNFKVMEFISCGQLTENFFMELKGEMEGRLRWVV
ncbi:hypothetical protein BD410DRAFT_787543 [Rickenella mellea]|uniref:Uncharacterized protein n=1 Tax=Rickenella mellea TaxID=50990 RepID=A0A4Y7Q8S0_9AGAM|nr:hypothetical protein BD410DRAFT_787543 [Rickenella mellea]